MRYFEDVRDSGNVYATSGGVAGIFRLFNQDRETGPWTFLIPYTDGWDFTHQMIFRNFECEEISHDKFLAMNLPPPLPKEPEGPFLSHAENLGRGKRLPVKGYPHVSAWISSTSLATVWVVLHEDLYETMFGDGKFCDFSNAFISRELAVDWIKLRQPGQLDHYLITSFSVSQNGSEIYSEDFNPGHFEHYSFERCVDCIEGYLNKFLQ